MVKISNKEFNKRVQGRNIDYINRYSFEDKEITEVLYTSCSVKSVDIYNKKKPKRSRTEYYLY